VIALLLLTGCATGTETSSGSPAAEQPQPSGGGDGAAGASAGTATATIGAREFSFELSGCTMYEGREVELSGLGGEVGTDVPSYLDGGAMQMDSTPLGEFRINIGADRPFQSSDDFIAFGAPTGGNFTVVKEGAGYLATGPAWDDNGTSLGTGTLHFTCG
jgi:hypothetical protein